MAYDATRFRRVYLPGELPLSLTEGWTVAAIDADRVRSAVDVRLVSADGHALTVFVERRVEGGQCFASTEQLQISYYSEAGVDDGRAARATRLLVDRLRAAEESASAEDLASALTLERDDPIRGQPQTLELRINRECNEECIFCNTPETSETILPGPDAIHAAILRERDAGYEDITFTGREPTLDPELPAYLRAAREAGYQTIRVQTNGTSFASGPMLGNLVEAGMNTAEISLHTLEPETFRRLVGPPGLLGKTLAGLARLAERPEVRVHLVVVLTRLNLGHLSAVLTRAAEVHPRLFQVTVSPMAPVGDGASHVDLIPRPDELREPLRLAFEVAREHRLRMRIPSRCGTPLCAMPEGTERCNDELDNAPGRTLEANKSKPAVCAGCTWDERCTGLWTACLAEWGDDAVRPVPPRG